MKTRRAERGIAAVDVLLVVIVILLVALFVAWNLAVTAHRTNELSAITMLRLLNKAEAAYFKDYKAYGSLDELSDLPGGLKRDDGQTGYYRGYYFRVFLPAAPAGGAGPAEAGDAAETAAPPRDQWCAYAWPSIYGITGRSSFFTRGEGTIYTEDDPDLSGKSPKKLTAGLACRDQKPFSEKVDVTRWELLGP